MSGTSCVVVITLFRNVLQNCDTACRRDQFQHEAASACFRTGISGRFGTVACTTTKILCRIRAKSAILTGHFKRFLYLPTRPTGGLPLAVRPTTKRKARICREGLSALMQCEILGRAILPELKQENRNKRKAFQCKSCTITEQCPCRFEVL